MSLLFSSRLSHATDGQTNDGRRTKLLHSDYLFQMKLLFSEFWRLYQNCQQIPLNHTLFFCRLNQSSKMATI